MPRGDRRKSGTFFGQPTCCAKRKGGPVWSLRSPCAVTALGASSLCRFQTVTAWLHRVAASVKIGLQGGAGSSPAQHGVEHRFHEGVAARGERERDNGEQHGARGELIPRLVELEVVRRHCRVVAGGGDLARLLLLL